MNEQLISSDTARLAKKKGFDWECSYSYGRRSKSPNFAFSRNSTGNVFSAPTQPLLQKWLREIHGIHIDTEAVGSEEEFPQYVQMVYTCPQDRIDYELRCLGFEDKGFEEQQHDAYEEALEAGLQAALKMIKK